MVDAAIASARQQLANLQFRFEETGIPYGFEAFTGPLGSSQVISVPSNANQDYVMRNDEWSLQVRIDKRDSETGNQIAADASFAVFEWDTVLQRYIPYGGYNQYTVERQADGTYVVVNNSRYCLLYTSTEGGYAVWDDIRDEIYVDEMCIRDSRSTARSTSSSP